MELLRSLYRRYDAHDVSTQAAALAYVFLFSLFPALFLLAALAPYLPLDGFYFDVHGAMSVQGMDDAEADLAVYRAQYGLPACTTANGCFRKVNQAGASSPLPAANSGSDFFSFAPRGPQP